jgi:hypothetical protein
MCGVGEAEHMLFGWKRGRGCLCSHCIGISALGAAFASGMHLRRRGSLLSGADLTPSSGEAEPFSDSFGDGSRSSPPSDSC